METRRKIRRIISSRPTVEGAGVHLRRGFGFREEGVFDPFLLLDDFRSNDPKSYIKGFPWHPHRGIETITYVLGGTVEHGDSMQNRGVIGPGDVQWMTAGSGIVHQEMPRGDSDGYMGGFQLWANLPAARKMMEPRYRDVRSSTIPLVRLDGGVEARVICGSVAGVEGPVQGIEIDPEYLDVTIPPGVSFVHPTKQGYTVFAYAIGGEGRFGGRDGAAAGNGSVVLFDEGTSVEIEGGAGPLRALLVSGRPLREPIAWEGPIVMNTSQELRVAFEELDNGTFLKKSTQR